MIQWATSYQFPLLEAAYKKITIQPPRTIDEVLQVFRDIGALESWEFLKKYPRVVDENVSRYRKALRGKGFLFLPKLWSFLNQPTHNTKLVTTPGIGNKVPPDVTCVSRKHLEARLRLSIEAYSAVTNQNFLPVGGSAYVRLHTSH